MREDRIPGSALIEDVKLNFESFFMALHADSLADRIPLSGKFHASIVDHSAISIITYIHIHIYIHVRKHTHPNEDNSFLSASRSESIILV